MNVFIRAMVRIFSFGERWSVPFNSAVASLNGTFHLSPHENILTIALINIHYLYIKQHIYFENCIFQIYFDSSSAVSLEDMAIYFISMNQIRFKIYRF